MIGSLPVRDARLEIRLDGRAPMRLRRFPDGADLPFAVRDGVPIFVCILASLSMHGGVP